MYREDRVSIDVIADAVLRRAAPPKVGRTLLRPSKRLLDVGVGAVLLIALLPVGLFIAIAVGVSSPGPIFFRQFRIGYQNRPFRLIKFRTMEHGSGRTTPLGRWLRRTSLDELPQLLHVLSGRMSLVGPRPHAVGSRVEGRRFELVEPLYPERHVVRPGITGLAQVRGFHGPAAVVADLSNRLAADLEYISGWSFLGDIRILLATLKVAARRTAY